jgi:hypothetical protein
MPTVSESMNRVGRPRPRWVLPALVALFIILAIIGGRHARRVHDKRAVVSATMSDLAAEARQYSQAQPASPADIATLARERPEAGRLLNRLRETLGSSVQIGFSPEGVHRAEWFAIAVSRRGVVLFEVSRDGDVRMYEPRLPSRSMGCHCLG